jgi:CubicO group peptidase (beta-lactamase class C family)/predicted aspartyl protease
LPTLRFPHGKDVVEVPFEVEGGWIILPVSINGSRAFRYVLDTGLSGVIHYNKEGADPLNVKTTGEMQVRGAGGGGAAFTVDVAKDVNFKIGDIELSNGHLAMRGTDRGHDGVIGRPLFAHLVVEIDWEKQVVRFYEPSKYKYSGSGSVLPLTFDAGGRPYATASVVMSGTQKIPVKLVVDTGGSHTLLLDAQSSPGIELPEGAKKAVLGRGASGEITGYDAKTKVLEFGGRSFNDVPTIFPDSSSGTAGINERQGNLGSGILRRFKIIYDYSRSQMIVEPNKFVNEPFVPRQSLATSDPAPDNSTLARELDGFLQEASKRDAFSGAVLVAKNGQPIFTKAYGLANKAANSPNRADTKFDLGSMNKMFTAVAIAQLAERGKLSFTDTVGKHLPDYPNKAVAEKVTIHQLLTHTSGMGNYQNEAFTANLTKIKTVAELLPFFVNDSLAFEPGAKMQYSNAGFALLGLVIEKVSGQNYFEYVKDHIFKPAGMMSTDSYERDKNTPNLALGYMRMNDRGMPDPSVPLRENTSIRPTKGSSAGGGYSTVEDMLKFSLALYGHKLLTPKYTETVTTGKVEAAGPDRKYGYGFGDSMIDGMHIIGHNGGGPGIGANFDIFPEIGYTAVVLSNYSAPTMMPVVKKVRELIKKSIAGAPKASTPHQAQRLTQAEQEVRSLEREWLDAYERKDAEAMERVLGDDFKLTRSNGSVQTKADILTELKSPPGSSGPSIKFSTEDVQSRVEGETVLLSGRLVIRSAQDGKTRMQARYTDRYVKRNGRWQVVASQMQRIQ